MKRRTMREQMGELTADFAALHPGYLLFSKKRAARMIRRRFPLPRAGRGRRAKRAGEGAPPQF